MALDISQVVRVTDRLTPTVVPTRNFGRTLFVTAAATVSDIDDIGKAIADDAGQPFSTARQVAETYDATDERYRAAQTYFAQSPYPQDLIFGAHHSAARLGLVKGREVTLTRAQIQALNTQSFTFLGQTGTITGIPTGSSLTWTQLDTNLSTSANALSGVTGAALGTLERGAGSQTVPSGATTFRFIASYPSALLTVAALDTDAGFSGPAAEIMGLTGEGVQFAPAQAASASIAETLSRLDAEDDSWYWFSLSDALAATDANVESASEWAESRRKFFAYGTNEVGVLTANESTSQAYDIFDAERERTFTVFSRTQDHKALSVCAWFSSANYEGAGPLPVGNLAQLPNTIPDTLSEAAIAELERKRINFYTRTEGTGVLREGWAADGFIDARVFVDWLVSAIQTGVFNTLRGARRVPLTNQGIALIGAAIDDALQRGVRNGGLAPGEVSNELRAEIVQATGNADFDGVLTSGYLVHVPIASDITESDRSARRVTGIRVFANGSSAIHNLDIDLTFRT